MKYAAHTDGLVLSLGATEPAALANALAHGAENEEMLDTLLITRDAALHVQAGGDCRALTLRMTRKGDEYFDLRSNARKRF